MSAMKINTGTYRVCRDQVGIANTKQILKEGDKSTIDNYWENLKQDPQYSYYKEEEVFYRGTTKDNEGNDIDTAPGFNRM